MARFTRAAIQPLNVDQLTDFVHGPFADKKKYSRADQRRVVWRCLAELERTNRPENLEQARRLREMLKTL